MGVLLKIENLEKYYGSKTFVTKAVDNISFEVKEGEFLGIMGASGSGKSTLLNCVSTIDTVTAGAHLPWDNGHYGIGRCPAGGIQAENPWVCFSGF